jgi:hypothetical protein
LIGGAINSGTESMALLDFIAARVLGFDQAPRAGSPSGNADWRMNLDCERSGVHWESPADRIAEPLRESISPEVFSRFEPTSVASYSSF